MKTINKLIELGLSKEMAVKVEDEIQIYKLFEIKMNQVTATKQEVIDSIVKAEPEFRQKDFVSQEDEFFLRSKNGRPEWSNEKTTGHIISVVPKIKKVGFKIGNKTLAIEDPVIIEMLRLSLIGAKVQPTRPRGNQKKHPGLKRIAVELMECKEGKDYTKRVFVGKIFALYLDELRDKLTKENKPDEDLQNYVASVLKR